MTSSRFLGGLLLCTLSLPASQLYEAVEPHMGSLFRIKLYADEQTAQAGFRAAFNRVEQLNNILSDYKADSELNLAAKRATSEPVHISADLARVIGASQQISLATDGAFDITVGPLTKLWRTARKEHRIPTADAIQQARERCGFRKLHIDEPARTLKLDAHDMQLDVGGIAKGYAAEEALLILKNMGIRRALVAASGDLAIGDPPPDQPGWKIGVDSLDRADKPFTRVLMLANISISTSSGTEQYLEINGTRYSHIIDPNTGVGLVNDITVTTVSRDGMTADAAALAVSVLGCEKGLAFIEQTRDVAAFILEKNGDRTSVFESTKFKERYGDH